MAHLFSFFATAFHSVCHGCGPWTAFSGILCVILSFGIGDEMEMSWSQFYFKLVVDDTPLLQVSLSPSAHTDTDFSFIPVWSLMIIRALHLYMSRSPVHLTTTWKLSTTPLIAPAPNPGGKCGFSCSLLWRLASSHALNSPCSLVTHGSRSLRTTS